MSDYYTEQLVKKKPDMKDMMTKAILIAVTIVSILAVLYYPIIILVPVLLIGLDIFMFHRLKVEYEYLYVNGDLDIDKIMNKSKRKRVFSMNVSDLEMLAPADAVELRQYQNAKEIGRASCRERV